MVLWLTPADIIVAAAGSGVTPDLLFKASRFVIFTFFLTRPDATAFFGASRNWSGLTDAFVASWVALTAAFTFLRLTVEELPAQCRLQDRDLQTIRKIYYSVTNFPVSLKPPC